jgi:hypothetical protein
VVRAVGRCGQARQPQRVADLADVRGVAVQACGPCAREAWSKTKGGSDLKLREVTRGESPAAKSEAPHAESESCVFDGDVRGEA